MKDRMSIRDAMLESIRHLHDEEAAIRFVRARIHIPRISNKRLREYYRETLQEVDGPAAKEVA